MAEGYIYIGRHKYWWYGTYTDKRRAYQIGKWIKKKYGGKYFILGTDTALAVRPRYHVYATKVRAGWT